MDDDHKTERLSGSNAPAERRSVSSQPRVRLPFWRWLLVGKLDVGGGKRAHFTVVLASMMIAFGGFASSKPYLLLLQPPPLRFIQQPLLNYDLLMKLGPLPTDKGTTNETTQAEPEEPAAPPETQPVALPGPVEAISQPVSSNPFPGLTLPPIESSVRPVEPVLPQYLIPYLCAPTTPTNGLAHPVMPLYFNPPQPTIPLSSSATYSTGKP
jgi:hypothetical protein